MRPAHLDPCSPHGEREHRRTSQAEVMTLPNRRRSRAEDSWVEISSRPSSSSLASSTNDLTSPNEQPRNTAHTQLVRQRSLSLAGSSQDEYDESESESDRILSSSNEDVGKDTVENTKSIAFNEGVFTPQPNAFSHPPSSQPSSYFAQANTSRSRLSEHRRPHLSRERLSGSVQPDHDAALRASLTTLLSCAAAVRPKPEKVVRRSLTQPSVQPTAMRLVSDMGMESRSAKSTKRRSRESSKERQAKKAKAKAVVVNEEVFSPMIASWMISAGVVIVLSAISFSAGYAWGKEAGRLEIELGIPSNCGTEARNGLRRLRWTTTSNSVRV